MNPEEQVIQSLAKYPVKYQVIGIYKKEGEWLLSGETVCTDERLKMVKEKYFKCRVFELKEIK